MMKIVAGMGSIDDFIPYVKAGADEIFCGYIPFEWYEKYGNTIPLNRREVRYVNVQIGTESEIEILKKMSEDYSCKVSLTFNSPFYSPVCYDDILKITDRCVSLGLSSFIVSDIALLLKIKSRGYRYADIHLSGEFGETNEYSRKWAKNNNCNRVIFNRKTSISDMKKIISRNPDTEYEAFVLNEMCHFSGGFCNSLHCDELCHICLVPYMMYGETKTDVGYDLPKYESTGKSGCGLCALWKLRDAGVTHLKIVSRGAHSEDTVNDIQILKNALQILESSESETDFTTKVKEELMNGNCSRNCYYRE